MTNKSLEDLAKRVEKLERVVFDNSVDYKVAGTATKSVTLSEIARKGILKNASGQQKIAIIIGYFELVKNEGASKPEKIKNSWKNGKFTGKYNPNSLSRAVGNLVRNNEDGSYDLTQEGEDFFREVMDATKNSTGTKK